MCIYALHLHAFNNTVRMRHNLRLRLAFKMAARLSMLSCRLVAVSLMFWLSLAEKYDGKQIAVTSYVYVRVCVRT